MSARKPGVPALVSIMKRSEERLWLDFKDAGEYDHRGNIGTAREDAVANFLKARLPRRYGIARGEVVDIGGVQSGQVDILIFDQNLNAPLLTGDTGLVLLPAEALLAAIEVKSTLTREETKNALRGFSKLRMLQPLGSSWGRVTRRGLQTSGFPRFMSSVFAFDTDLKAEDWTTTELKRLRTVAKENAIPSEYIEWAAVLSRGVARVPEGRVAKEPEHRGVLGMWFFGLLNFLVREADRREPVPWSLYEEAKGRTWATGGPPLFDAPPERKRSAKQRREYTRGGSR